MHYLCREHGTPASHRQRSYVSSLPGQSSSPSPAPSGTLTFREDNALDPASISFFSFRRQTEPFFDDVRGDTKFLCHCRNDCVVGRVRALPTIADKRI